ncbi:hypothetical protein SERLADRAFT_465926 [Serpula lacrymans var. lacrymans S7.9]|uniref:Uncharacterized protein n=1 Tax=Serpula lacrymans var. lacrymans (strain S7.9) TaxID=578457 RepID=F8NTA5_SERL9|nr:uncharacterized protein SERLADRAFT_465926 [Serpula lacrymans var. lacrymans S7.9]EGO25578.1 hypothetical protein SERLADRAFT_465926 [Serpula lacrymans var. lacrymans S7.9]
MSDSFTGSSLEVVYTTSETHAIVTLIVVSCVSVVAVVGLLCAISISAYNTRASSDKNLFVRTHVAAYFVSLLCSDLLQAVGSIMNEEWIRQHVLTTGTFCVAQGAIKQAADVGTAMWSLIIAIHTFCILFLRMQMRPYSLWLTLLGGWSVVAGIVISGPLAYDNSDRGPFYGISGYWCWISANYATERITLDYMIMFISAVLSFILYSSIFLRLRGNIIIHGWHITFRFRKRTSSSWRGRDFAGNQMMMIAKQMLLYPIAYTILILPIAAARFSSWAGKDVPFAVTIFCDAVFLFSGAVNVTLFTTTRRILPPDSIMRRPLISLPRPSTITEAPADFYERSVGKEFLDIAELPRRPESAASHPSLSTVTTVVFQNAKEHANIFGQATIEGQMATEGEPRDASRTSDRTSWYSQASHDSEGWVFEAV